LLSIGLGSVKLVSMAPLDISAAEFRALADAVVTFAAEFEADLDEMQTVTATSALDTAKFDLPLPEEGFGQAVVRDLESIAEHVRAPTGRRVPYVVGSGDLVGALGDFYASVLNQNVTAWRSAPAAVAIERTVIRGLAEAIGCSGFAGTFTSGGSLGNLMALAMARESRAAANEEGAQPGVVYASEEVHMSIPKAIAMLGLGRANLRLIAVDEHMRIDVPTLEEAIVRDREAGVRGVAIVGSAGTVMTGAVDPLGELAEVARRYNLWLHIDGAYGAPAALAVPEKFVGMSEADSISLDAHKWLYQPLDCSILLYRDADAARRTFAYAAEYVRTTTDDPVEGFAFFDQTIELSRRFRALKLWLSLRYHGLEAFRAAIADNLAHARLLAELIQAAPAFELIAPVDLSAVCFRYVNGDAAGLNALNEMILREITAAGRVWLSNAHVRGMVGLRACITNHRTTEQDIHTIVEEVIAAAGRVAA
jgi:aromatic-L-amino-acid decarboxylase